MSEDFNLKSVTRQKIQAATAAAKALRSLSYSSSARRDLYLAGAIPLLTRLTLCIGSSQRDQPILPANLRNRAASVASNTPGQKTAAANPKVKYIFSL